MDKQTDSEEIRNLRLLEALAEEPEIRQVDLAARLGMAVGTVNWLLKRLTAKGYVKVKRIGQWHWRYLLTPPGPCGEGPVDPAVSPGLHVPLPRDAAEGPATTE
jgi:hypothetical protein